MPSSLTPTIGVHTSLALSTVAPESTRSLQAAIGLSALYGLLSGIVIAQV